MNTDKNVHIVNNKVFALQKKSKWTWEALNEGESVATDKSRPKLIAKLNEMYTEEPQREIKAKPTVKNEALARKLEKKAKRTIKRETPKTDKPKSTKAKKQSMRNLTLELIKNGRSDLSLIHISEPTRPY